MSAARRRCRELGLVIGSLSPGPKNSITDVKGVRVGHTTLSFNNKQSTAQTGVTAIWPADGDLVREPVPAGSFVLNGFGEITGRAAADEWGIASTPISKLAKRAALGLARIGSIGANCSGELMFAFTNANRVRASGTLSNSIEVMNDRRIDALYQAVIEATEESVVNALFKAHTAVGRDGNTLHAIPIEQTLELLHKYGRI